MEEKPEEEERSFREVDMAERENGLFSPKEREREFERAGWRRGERVGLQMRETSKYHNDFL